MFVFAKKGSESCFASKIYADTFIDSYTGKVAAFAERFAHIYNR